MPGYTTSPTFRQAAHDAIETKFGGGHADPLHSSNTSLHLDAGDPSLKVQSSAVYVYNGNVRQYRLRRLSDIETDDRVFSASGHIELSDTVVELYKAFTKGLHDREFRLAGGFDCANKYIKAGVSRSAFQALPVIQADTWYPYYYRHSSGLKGVVTYDKFPPSEGPTRRVICINVRGTGELSGLIPNGHVVYLAGEHGEKELANLQTPSLAPNPLSKYVQYRLQAPLLGPGAVDIDSEELVISSPFPQTWRAASERGLNVGLAALHNGHFLYWSTDCSPSPGNQISPLSYREIPTDSFQDPKGVVFPSWPVFVNDDVVEQYDLFQGAWVMRGTHLVQSVREDEYPAVVLDRLRGGFFRTRDTEVVPSFTRILSRLLKAKQSVQRYGGKMFGFQDKPGGIVQCDIQSLATFARIPLDALLAFIPLYSSSFQLFRATVNFLCLEKPTGLFDINKPLPIGPWMHGHLMHTGTGLLYSRSNDEYLSVTRREGVSCVTDCTGGGLSTRKDLVLAPLIAGVSYD